MKRVFVFAVLLSAGVLAGCGKSASSGGGSVASGPSPYSGHDKAWFVAHPKENDAENAWCKANNGYFNPLVKEQAKTYDPACDIASSAWYSRVMNAKTRPGAF